MLFDYLLRKKKNVDKVRALDFTRENKIGARIFSCRILYEDFKASDSDISNATYGFVFPKYCDKDFNFILCQESSGAKKLSSTEDSYMNPTEIQQQKQQSELSPFGSKFWLKPTDGANVFY